MVVISIRSSVADGEQQTPLRMLAGLRCDKTFGTVLRFRVPLRSTEKKTYTHRGMVTQTKEKWRRHREKEEGKNSFSETYTLLPGEVD